MHKESKLLSLAGKKNLSILITDSGMGGLSICAEIVESLKKSTTFEEINITYFNAWPEQDRGYNRLESDFERIRVFDAALKSMERYEPDIILIACNTLSIIYNETEFSKKAEIPVLDIVDFGVSVIKEKLDSSEDSGVLITGTLTTIESEEHKKRLIHSFIPEEKIFTQHCDQLATSIEKGPESDATISLIEKYMSQASQKIPSNLNPVYIALCCTHFGYAEKNILKYLEQNIKRKAEILNPNKAMASFVADALKNKNGGNNKDCRINIEVVSKIEWNDERVNAIAELIEKISPSTAEALRNYSYLPNLFTF